MKQWAHALLGVLWVCTRTSSFAQPVPGSRFVDIQVNDAVYDKASDRLYISTPSNSSKYPQSLVVVNPSDLSFPQVLSLPSEINRLKLTSDGSTLYGLSSPATILQIDVSSFQIQNQYQVAYSDAVPNEKVTDFLPVSDGTGRMAVSFTDSNGNYIGTAAFSGATRLPVTLNSVSISEMVESPTPGVVYGYNGLNTGFDISQIQVTGTGLTLIGSPATGLVIGFGTHLAVSGGLLYATDSSVTNVQTSTMEGFFPFQARPVSLVIDDAAGVIYFAGLGSSGQVYEAHNIHNFLTTARLSVTQNPQVNVSNLKKLLLTNEGDLVVVSPGSESGPNSPPHLVFIPTASLTPLQPVAVPPVVQVTPQLRQLPLPVSAITADPTNGNIYVLTDSFTPGIGNGVFTLNPTTGKASDPVFAGSFPLAPKASPDGKFLYMSGRNSGDVIRFRLPEMVLDSKIKLPTTLTEGGYPLYAGSILPIPGQPKSFAVLTYETTTDNEHWLGVYDDATIRPKTLSRDVATIDSMAISSDANHIYGLDGGSLVDPAFSRVLITPQGVSLDASAQGVGLTPDRIGCDGDWCVTASGQLLDPVQIRRLGMVASGVAGLNIPDHKNNRIYILSSGSAGAGFWEYDATTMLPVRYANLPISGYLISFIRWSPTGFAALSTQGIWLFSTDTLLPMPVPSGPTVTSTGAQRQTNVAARTIVYDRGRDLVYASVPMNVLGNTQLSFWSIIGNAASQIQANTLMALDPHTGKVVKTLPLGSDPGALDLSDDGQFAYVGLTTGSAIVRVNLNQWQRDQTYITAGSPAFINARPGHPTEFLSAFGPGVVGEFGGAFPYDFGVWLYQNGQRLATPALTNINAVSGLFVDSNSAVASDLYQQGADSLIRVTANGLSKDSPPPFPTLNQPPLAVSGNELFGAMGTIADPKTLKFLNEVAEYGAVVPVPEQSRIYYLRREGVRVYDWTTLRVLGFLPFQNEGDHARMIYCGPTCLAVQNLGAITFLDTGAIQWANPNANQPVRSSDGSLEIPLRVTAMQYDAKRQLLFVSTPAEAGPVGNSVVPVNPATGELLPPIFAGTFPTAIALSNDDRQIFVSTRGTRNIQTLDLQSQKNIATTPVPQINLRENYWAEGIAPFPGAPNTLGLSIYDGGAWWNWRAVMVGGDGKMLPNYAPNGVTGNFVIGQQVFFSASGNRLQMMGSDNLGTNGIWSLPVSSAGVSYSPKLGGNPGTTVGRCNGSVFVPDGRVLNGETLESIKTVTVPKSDTFGADGVACDETQDRLYYTRTTRNKVSIYIYQLSTQSLIGTRSVPGDITTVQFMSALGPYGVALWSGYTYNGPYVTPPATDRLVIIPISGLTPPAGLSLNLQKGQIAEISPTNQAGGSLLAGFAVVQSNFGSNAYSGYEIITNRTAGITVSQMAVRLSDLVQSGVVYAEIGSGMDTGIAIANPNSLASTISFSFRSTDGTLVKSGTLIVAANQQVSEFFDQDPFNLPPSFVGAMTFTASQPVAIIALRGRVNERSEFLMSALPISSPSDIGPSSGGFAQFAAGVGWTTDIILTNPSPKELIGSFRFLNDPGNAMSVQVDGQSGNSFPYDILPGAAKRFHVDSAGSSVQVGSIQLIGAANTPVPTGTAIFAFKPGGVTITETAVARSTFLGSGTVYAQKNSDTQTGIAIANPASTSATVSLVLTDRSGSVLGSASVELPANGHAAMLLGDLPQFSSLAAYDGLLSISGPSPGFELTALQLHTNERGEFLMSTLEPVDAEVVSQAQRVFPQVVFGGSFSTDLILFNTRDDVSGVIDLFSSTGATLGLTLQ
jgi:hypothetical protein